MDFFLLGVLLLYWTLIAILLYGIARTRDDASNTSQPFVSVIVAARNEEQTLPNCLSSLAVQTYPPGLFEVIVVNDHSEDGTARVCTAFAGRFQHFHALVPEPDPVLRGKTNALARGIAAAAGEIIMVTDADCTVPPTWIESTVRRYNPKVGLVGGVTVQRATGPFTGAQSLDWAFLLGLAASAVNLRNPLSTIGNNLSFRRSAYEEVGGYRSIKFSVTEDYALFQAIVRTGCWEYYYLLDPAHLVVSEPCSTLRELVRQKQRWGKGGLDMKASGLAVMAIGFLMHAGIVGGLLLGAWELSASVFLGKAIGDYTFLQAVLKRIDRLQDRKYFYWFELYYLLYVLLLPFIVFFGGKVRWKGREY